MKEALTLLLVLMMGRAASQAFGFSLTSPDNTVKESLYNQVDIIYEKEPGRLATIAGKLPTIKRHFVGNPADVQLLDDLATYIDYKLNEPTTNEYSAAIASALTTLFE